MRVYPALEAWLTIMAVAAAVVVSTAVCGLIAVGLSPREGRTSAGRESRHVLRTSRHFADLVAMGDFESAEAVIAEASRSRVIEWDERALLDLPLDKARLELTETAPAATWFPDVRRMARGDGEEILLGREEPIHLTIVSEVWTPELDGMDFQAFSGASSIMGSLSLRTVVTGVERSTLRTTVEVVIHMEAIDVPEARRALTRARTITHDGLTRMAATLNPH